MLTGACNSMAYPIHGFRQFAVPDGLLAEMDGLCILDLGLNVGHSCAFPGFVLPPHTSHAVFF